MKKSPYPQRKKALLWGSLALVCFLAVLALSFLESAPCFTLEQAMRQAEQRYCTQETTVLDSKTQDNTTFYLTGNEDVLMVIPCSHNPLIRLKEMGNRLSCFDRNGYSFAQDQGVPGTYAASMVLEDQESQTCCIFVLGTTELPQAASVQVSVPKINHTAYGDGEPPFTWSDQAEIRQSPYGYGFFYVMKVIPISDSYFSSTSEAYHFFQLTFQDPEGTPVAELNSYGFSAQIQGTNSLS